MIGGSDYATELNSLRPWDNLAPAITVEERLARIEKARQLMIDNGADALIVGASTGTAARDRKSTRLNSSHNSPSRMPSSA